jgi:hypothetical protein
VLCQEGQQSGHHRESWLSAQPRQFSLGNIELVAINPAISRHVTKHYPECIRRRVDEDPSVWQLDEVGADFRLSANTSADISGSINVTATSKPTMFNSFQAR